MGKRKSRRRRKRGQKMEFSQRPVVVSWVVTIVWITLSYALSFMERNPNETVTVALITESFGVTIAYFCYQGALKTSRNKHGVDKDGIPFKVKQKLETAGIMPDEDNEESS